MTSREHEKVAINPARLIGIVPEGVAIENGTYLGAA
jgi:hypothetical protein